MLGPNGRWGCRERVARRSTPYAGAHRRTPYTEVRAANEQASGKRQHEKDRTKPNKQKETAEAREDLPSFGARVVAITPLLLPLFVDI